jgi:MoaA/NifB/PqqE/SkfB family radical SAM enzyme
MLRLAGAVPSYVISSLITHLPVIVTHMVTARCVSRCKVCTNWREPHKGREMSTAEVLGLIEEAKRQNFLAYIAWGGEPLLRGDIFEILGRSYRLGMFTVLITNGYLLPPVAGKVAKTTDFVWVSLDHHTAKHDEIRGLEGSFERALDGIRGLKAAGANVAINCVVSKLNMGCGRRMAELAAELGVKLSYDDVEAFRGVNDCYALGPDERSAFFREALELKRRRYPIINSEEFLRAQVSGERYRCHQPEVFIKVSEDGKVVPFWCHICREPFGDLRREGLGEIIRSPRYREFSEAAKSCSVCTNQTTMECSIFWDAARMFRKTYAMQNPLFGAIRDYLM